MLAAAAAAPLSIVLMRVPFYRLAPTQRMLQTHSEFLVTELHKLETQKEELVGGLDRCRC